MLSLSMVETREREGSSQMGGKDRAGAELCIANEAANSEQKSLKISKELGSA